MDMHLESCPVCHKNKHRSKYSLDSGELLHCVSCGLIFFAPRPTSDELALLYDTSEYRQDYSESAMANLTFAKARYQNLTAALSHYVPNLLRNSSKTLLDIGCGKGDFLRVADQSKWDVTGLEISSLAVRQANKQLGANKVIEGDLHSVSLPLNSYDLITSFHVIEHLLNPLEHLTQIKKLLEPRGVLFLETPNISSIGSRIRGSKWSHIIPPEHINYFDPRSLATTLKLAGFDNFFVFTSAPPVIESIQDWHFVLRVIAEQFYRIAPKLNMGAALQAIAFKE